MRSRLQPSGGSKNDGAQFDNLLVNTTGGDSIAPTAPGSLTGTAASSTQINLSWSAASDNVGVTGYKVYRNGTEIGTTTSRSYAATGLAAQTAYTFTAAAFDAANNTSAPSTAVSATTLAATVGTSLADLAARLKAGEWGELTTNGFDTNTLLYTPRSANTILAFADEAGPRFGRRIRAGSRGNDTGKGKFLYGGRPPICNQDVHRPTDQWLGEW